MYYMYIYIYIYMYDYMVITPLVIILIILIILIIWDGGERLRAASSRSDSDPSGELPYCDQSKPGTSPPVGSGRSLT